MINRYQNIPANGAYFSSRQNSSSPCFTALGSGFFGGTLPPACGLGGSDFNGLLIDDKAILSSSSSSVVGFRGSVGFAGGASFRCGCAFGAVGACGRADPGLGAAAAGGRFTLDAGACGAAGLRVAAADQPQAEHAPFTFNGSPHSLHSGIGWLDSSNRGELITDFGAAEFGRCGAAELCPAEACGAFGRCGAAAGLVCPGSGGGFGPDAGFVATVGLAVVARGAVAEAAGFVVAACPFTGAAGEAGAELLLG